MGNKLIWVRGLVFLAVFFVFVLLQEQWVSWMLGEVKGGELLAQLSTEVYQIGALYALLAIILPSQARLEGGEGQSLRYTKQDEMLTACILIALIVPPLVGDYFLLMASNNLMEYVYIAAVPVTYLGAFIIKRIQQSQGDKPMKNNFWRLKIMEMD